MTHHSQALDWIATQQPQMVALMEELVGINSWTDNKEGIDAVRMRLERAGKALGAETALHPLPPRKKQTGEQSEIPCGPALLMKKRVDAPIQVLLGGHMDTVYPPDPAIRGIWVDKRTFQGPGAADMKGGIVILLYALEALERSSHRENIGWEVVLVPDEEVGSPSSRGLWHEKAHHFDLGLLFESALPNADMIDRRGGSAHFTVTVTGRSAHAGRDFFAGKNAIVAMAELILKAKEITSEQESILVNVGQVHGGTAPNVVPETAYCHINIRAPTDSLLSSACFSLRELATSMEAAQGLAITVTGGVTRPAKPLDPQTQSLCKAIELCGNELGHKISWQSTLGVCDGNLLGAEGLATIDTLGVVGGKTHSSEEYCLVETLTQRAQLTALLLLKLAAGEITIKEGVLEWEN